MLSNPHSDAQTSPVLALPPDLPQPQPLIHRTVRPFGVYRLQGLVHGGDRLLTLDRVRGYLLQVDPKTDNTAVLNPHQWEAFQDGMGLAMGGNTLWWTKGNAIYYALGIQELLAAHDQGQPLPPLKVTCFASLEEPVEGIAVGETAVYVSCQRRGYIYVFNGETGQMITRLYAPGVGDEALLLRQDELWVCDQSEQTVYCLDRASGEVGMSFLTPFERPTGLAFYQDPDTHQELLYVAYATEEPYVRDDPNALDSPHQLAFRDRTFLHPLHRGTYPQRHYSLSNGYQVELSYVEELSPLDAVHLENVEWRMALPSQTLRQEVCHIEPVGMPFTEEVQDGERVAVFRFDALQPHEGRLFGWKAVLNLRSIKYHLTPPDLEPLPPMPADLKARYLIDDDNLAMDTPIMRRAAQEVVAGETNLLRKVLQIRDSVYDRLAYGIKPRIDTPDVVWERQVGSCGEYVGVLLALLRLNGIACRTVGRYKCPTQAGDRHGVPLQPDFNHVWLEFYIPGIGWIPMESNPDGLSEGGPYPMRFFMGLAWYHAELGRGIPFERVLVKGQPLREYQEDLSLGDLAINHVRFVIHRELPPPQGQH